MDSARRKTIIKLLLVVAMACFLFPFAMVSCSGERVEATGMELMTGIATEEISEFSGSESPNPYLIIAFVCDLAGLFVVWKTRVQNRRMLITGGLTAGSAVCLLLFRATFWDRYGLSVYADAITVEFRWGWIASLAADLCASGISFYSQCMGKQSRAVLWRKQVGKPSGAPGKKQEPDSDPGLYIMPGTNQVLRPNTETVPETAPLEGLQEEPEVPLTVVIRYAANGKQQEFTLTQLPCLIGRDSTACEVPVGDPKASRLHAQLYQENHGIYIIDMGSSNGTKVNGQVITTPAELLSGDAVLIGNTELLFEIKE